MNDELLEKIIEAAREAGKIIRGAEKIDEAVKAKEGHANFVTKYDSQVQTFLFERMKKLVPDANFLGEENGSDKFKEEYRKGFCFIIDPIDGTTNFINQYWPSVISIALLKDGVPYLAVIYNPYFDEVYYAKAGFGAFCNGKQIFSTRKPLSESLVAFGTCPYSEDLHKKSFDAAMYYLKLCADVRRSGSAAWDLCCVASGKVALFFEYSLGVWDYAAGFLIVREAGGKVTDTDGNELNFDKRTSVIAVGQALLDTDYLPKV